MSSPDEPERPMRRRGDGVGVRSRTYWTARGVVPRWQLLLVYVFVAVIGIVGFIRIGSQASNAEAIAKENQHLVIVTHNLTRALADQRSESIRRTCNDQNGRHDDALEKLGGVLRRSVADPVVRERIREQNAILIQAIIPKKNCDRLVARSTTP